LHHKKCPDWDMYALVVHKYERNKTRRSNTEFGGRSTEIERENGNKV
jgi:hypothetical protein